MLGCTIEDAKRTIRDPEGNVILFSNQMDARECCDLASGHLRRPLEVIGILEGEWGLILDREAVRLRPLSIPERGAIAALAWHCKKFAPGLEKGKLPTFPMCDVCDDDTWFGDEARAYQFAHVVEPIFGLKGQVVWRSRGWAVIVGRPGDEFSGATFAEMQGACRTLMDFPIGEYDNVMCSNSDELTPSPEARRTWHERTNAQASRIELKLDALLSRLDAHVDPHRDTTAAKDVPAAVDVLTEDDNSDKHQRREPSRKSGKSSAKKEG